MIQKISVIIPTYYNPKKINQCLHSLVDQNVTPDEAIIIYMEKDKETDIIINKFNTKKAMRIFPLPVQNMSKMSRILNKGIKKTSGTIVVFIDEDIIPKKDWLSMLISTLKTNDISACGGKDIITVHGRRVSFLDTKDVGIIKWKGFIVGNHHRGCERRDVLFLKGCNMAIKKEYLRTLDENLLGFVRWEQEIFFPLTLEGRRVVYDPAIQVLHLKGRLQYLTPKQTFWYGHNTVYLFRKYLKGMNRFLAIVFLFFIGDMSSPGVFRFIFWIMTRNDQSICSFCTSLLGKLKGFVTHVQRLMRTI